MLSSGVVICISRVCWLDVHISCKWSISFVCKAQPCPLWCFWSYMTVEVKRMKPDIYQHVFHIAQALGLIPPHFVLCPRICRCNWSKHLVPPMRSRNMMDLIASGFALERSLGSWKLRTSLGSFPDCLGKVNAVLHGPFLKILNRRGQQGYRDWKQGWDVGLCSSWQNGFFSKQDWLMKSWSWSRKRPPHFQSRDQP